ncbi:hypothetical protein [Terribacillus saccharophilus]|uniref:hypothetical protein n=1 Tax=Terribacillus saccharophilus TaxID=361277 RepID=UPI0015957A63|nr:hypothetical protein [Terribacillus saccharophilus]
MTIVFLNGSLNPLSVTRHVEISAHYVKDSIECENRLCGEAFHDLSIGHSGSKQNSG